LVVDEAEHGADRVLVQVEVRDRERVPPERERVLLELPRVPLELERHEVGAEAQHLQRWARRTKPVRKVKRM
jgi:hypothetical protein